jgi:hypothetical protein
VCRLRCVLAITSHTLVVLGLPTIELGLWLRALVLHVVALGDDARNAGPLRLAAHAEGLGRPGCRDCARHGGGRCGREGGVG